MQSDNSKALSAAVALPGCGWTSPEQLALHKRRRPPPPPTSARHHRHRFTLRMPQVQPRFPFVPCGICSAVPFPFPLVFGKNSSARLLPALSVMQACFVCHLNLMRAGCEHVLNSIQLRKTRTRCNSSQASATIRATMLGLLFKKNSASLCLLKKAITIKDACASGR